MFLGKSNTPGWGTPFCDVTGATQHSFGWGTPFLWRHRRHSTQLRSGIPSVMVALRTLPSSPFRLALRTVSSQSTHINILIIGATSTSSLVHHIDYTKNTSLAFHPVIPRHVSVTIEPRRRAQRARDGAPAHHEPSCPQGLYMGKFILVYINLLCWWFVWEGSMWH